MSWEVETAHASRRGPRQVNEDFGGVIRADDPRRGLIAALADGVSAGGGGLEAAQTTVMSLLADFFAAPETWETTVVLDRLISAQNAWLADHNQRRRGGDRTALTTLTALALRGQTWTVAHVGDTRAWLLRAPAAGEGADENGSAAAAPGTRSGNGAEAQPELRLLTHDHAFDHPDQRSRLTRAVGLDDVVRVDYSQGDVLPGDIFLLTSDGVHGVLAPERLLVLAAQAAWPRAGGVAQACEALVDAALAAGGHDNASALLIRVVGLDARQLPDEVADMRRLPAVGSLKVGDRLDGYTITARVADNGVHRLYQARAAAGSSSGALVAIKTLSAARAADREERAMLAHEAWLGLQIGGAAGERVPFVRVHPRDANASALYVVFDWHAGRTLEQLMAEADKATPATTRPTVQNLIAAALAVTRGLARLHRHGVVHRDIKPGNLHLADDGQWRIFDLGSAVSGRESAAQRELHAGTPSYMNPEQWDGAAADAGSDLFALGVTLYQWLTGRLPYGEVEPYQRGAYKRDPVPVSRLRPDVPIWLDHLLAKTVARDPKQRFETAEELLLALERGASRPVSPPPPTPLALRNPDVLLKIALALSLLLNLMLIGWLLFLPR